MRILPCAILVHASYGVSFADLWGTLDIQQRYALLYSFPKGGDIHNHLSGTGHAEQWLKFGRNASLTRGEKFYTRYQINSNSRGDAVLWETIPECALAKLKQREQNQFKLLQALSKADQLNWVKQVRVLGKKDARAHFYDTSFRVLGGLTDNLYVKTEILVYWMKQLGLENAVYLETMAGLNFEERCVHVKKLDALGYIENRLQQADVNSSQVEVYFQEHVPRTHENAQQRLLDVISDLDSGSYPLWVGGNIVGPEQDDRGSLDLLVSETVSAELSKCQSCRWSVHAGELRCKNRNVLDAIEKFNASRIGHGLNWFDDGPIMADTLASLRARDILIETNLISNKVLDILKDFQDHPLPRLLEHNISTCLSTDDSAMWGSTLTDEYMMAADLLPKDLLFDAFIQMGFNSLKHSFAPEHVKDRLLRLYSERLDEFRMSCLTGRPQNPETCLRTPGKKSAFACAHWPDLCRKSRKSRPQAKLKGHSSYLQVVVHIPAWRTLWCIHNFRRYTDLRTRFRLCHLLLTM